MDNILKELKIKVKDLLDENGQICYMTVLQSILEKTNIYKMDIDTCDDFNYSKYYIVLEINKKLKCNNGKLKKESEKIQNELYLQKLDFILEDSSIESFFISKKPDSLAYDWIQSTLSKIQEYKIEFTVVKNI